MSSIRDEVKNKSSLSQQQLNYVRQLEQQYGMSTPYNVQNNSIRQQVINSNNNLLSFPTDEELLTQIQLKQTIEEATGSNHQKKLNPWETAVVGFNEFNQSLNKGIIKVGEGIVDFVLTGFADLGKIFGADTSGLESTITRDFSQDAINVFNQVYNFVDFVNSKEVKELAYNQTVDVLPPIAENIAGGVGSALGYAVLGAIPYAGPVLMFGSAAGSGAESALQEGHNLLEASTYGAISGGIEMAVEKLTGGLSKALGLGGGKLAGVTKMGRNLGSTTANKSIAKEIFKNMGEEGIEEVISNLVDPINRMLTLGDGEGNNVFEKYANVFEENGGVEGLVESFIGGAIGAGVVGGSQTMIGIKRAGGTEAYRLQMETQDLADIQSEIIDLRKDNVEGKNDEKIAELEQRKEKIKERVGEKFKNFLERVETESKEFDDDYKKRVEKYKGEAMTDAEAETRASVEMFVEAKSKIKNNMVYNEYLRQANMTDFDMRKAVAASIGLKMGVPTEIVEGLGESYFDGESNTIKLSDAQATWEGLANLLTHEWTHAISTEELNNALLGMIDPDITSKLINSKRRVKKYRELALNKYSDQINKELEAYKGRKNKSSYRKELEREAIRQYVSEEIAADFMSQALNTKGSIKAFENVLDTLNSKGLKRLMNNFKMLIKGQKIENWAEFRQLIQDGINENRTSPKKDRRFKITAEEKEKVRDSKKLLVGQYNFYYTKAIQTYKSEENFPTEVKEIFDESRKYILGWDTDKNEEIQNLLKVELVRLMGKSNDALKESANRIEAKVIEENTKVVEKVKPMLNNPLITTRKNPNFDQKQVKYLQDVIKKNPGDITREEILALNEVEKEVNAILDERDTVNELIATLESDEAKPYVNSLTQKQIDSIDDAKRELRKKVEKNEKIYLDYDSYINTLQKAVDKIKTQMEKASKPEKETKKEKTKKETKVETPKEEKVEVKQEKKEDVKVEKKPTETKPKEVKLIDEDTRSDLVHKGTVFAKQIKTLKGIDAFKDKVAKWDEAYKKIWEYTDEKGEVKKKSLKDFTEEDAVKYKFLTGEVYNEFNKYFDGIKLSKELLEQTKEDYEYVKNEDTGSATFRNKLITAYNKLSSMIENKEIIDIESDPYKTVEKLVGKKQKSLESLEKKKLKQEELARQKEQTAEAKAKERLENSKQKVVEKLKELEAKYDEYKDMLSSEEDATYWELTNKLGIKGQNEFVDLNKDEDYKKLKGIFDRKIKALEQQEKIASRKAQDAVNVDFINQNVFEVYVLIKNQEVSGFIKNQEVSDFIKNKLENPSSRKDNDARAIRNKFFESLVDNGKLKYKEFAKFIVEHEDYIRDKINAGYTDSKGDKEIYTSLAYYSIVSNLYEGVRKRIEELPNGDAQYQKFLAYLKGLREHKNATIQQEEVKQEEPTPTPKIVERDEDYGFEFESDSTTQEETSTPKQVEIDEGFAIGFEGDDDTTQTETVDVQEEKKEEEAKKVVKEKLDDAKKQMEKTVEKVEKISKDIAKKEEAIKDVESIASNQPEVAVVAEMLTKAKDELVQEKETIEQSLDEVFDSLYKVLDEYAPYISKMVNSDQKTMEVFKQVMEWLDRDFATRGKKIIDLIDENDVLIVDKEKLQKQVANLIDEKIIISSTNTSTMTVDDTFGEIVRDITNELKEVLPFEEFTFSEKKLKSIAKSLGEGKAYEAYTKMINTINRTRIEGVKLSDLIETFTNEEAAQYYSIQTRLYELFFDVVARGDLSAYGKLKQQFKEFKQVSRENVKIIKDELKAIIKEKNAALKAQDKEINKLEKSNEKLTNKMDKAIEKLENKLEKSNEKLTETKEQVKVLKDEKKALSKDLKDTIKQNDKDQQVALKGVAKTVKNLSHTIDIKDNEIKRIKRKLEAKKNELQEFKDTSRETQNELKKKISESEREIRTLESEVIASVVNEKGKYVVTKSFVDVVRRTYRILGKVLDVERFDISDKASLEVYNLVSKGEYREAFEKLRSHLYEDNPELNNPLFKDQKDIDKFNNAFKKLETIFEDMVEKKVRLTSYQKALNDLATVRAKIKEVRMENRLTNLTKSTYDMISNMFGNIPKWKFAGIKSKLPALIRALPNAKFNTLKKIDSTKTYETYSLRDAYQLISFINDYIQPIIDESILSESKEDTRIGVEFPSEVIEMIDEFKAIATIDEASAKLFRNIMQGTYSYMRDVSGEKKLALYNGETMKAADLSKKTVGDQLELNEKAKKNKFFGKMRMNMLQKGTLDPRVVIKYVGGMDENSMIYRVVYQGLQTGRRRYQDLALTYKGMLDNLLSRNKGYTSEFRKLVADKEKIKIKIGADEKNSESVEMSIGQALNLVGLSKDSHAYESLLANGMEVDNVTFKFNDVKAEETLTEEMTDESKKEANKERDFAKEVSKLRSAILDNVIKQIEDELKLKEKNFYSDYLEYATKVFQESKSRKVETDEEILGYSNVIDGQYWRINAAGHELDLEFDLKAFQGGKMGALNPGFNISRRGLSKPRIDSISNVINSYQREMQLYYGYASQIKTIQRMMTYRVTVEDADGNITGSISTSDAIKQRFHKDDNKFFDLYLTELVRDIQDIKPQTNQFERGVTRLLNKLKSNFVTFALGMNPKVMITQFASFGAAMKNLSGEALVKGLTGASKYKYYKEPTLLRYRSSTGQIVDAYSSGWTSAKNKFTLGIQKVDEFTVRRLWYASLYEMEKRGYRGDKLVTEATSLFEKVVNETQPNYDAIERSLLLRGRHGILQVLNMFKTQPYKLLSNIMEEYMYFKAKREFGYTENRNKQRVDLMKSIIWNGALYSILALIINKLINGDWDEEPEEEALEFTEDFLNTTFVGLIPFVSNIVEFDFGNKIPFNFNELTMGYLDAFSDIGSMINDFESVSVKKVIDATGRLAGVPSGNVYRFAKGILQYYMPSQVYEFDKAYSGSIATIGEAPSKQSISYLLDDGKNSQAKEYFKTYNKAIMNLTSSTTNEMWRLYKDNRGVALKTIPTTLKYKGKEIQVNTQRFKNNYSKVSTILDKFTSSNLDDETKASAIQDVLDIYYNYAKKKELGTNLSFIENLIDAGYDIEVNDIIALQQLDNIEASDKKKAIQTAINRMNGSKGWKYLIYAMYGYSLSERDRNFMINYLRGRANINKIKKMFE